VVVFAANGAPLGQFGSAGLGPGQFDEPVGIAINPDGILYVADTWNQRIQSFAVSADGLLYEPLKQWDVVAWYGQSLDNKPYLAVGPNGHVFATDPEGYRVLEFTAEGEFVRFWGDLSSGLDGFTLVGGVAVDAQGGVWVADAGASRLLHFTLP
jgi:sugar lactone lactonase YvrE